jgi:hypothetical protein
MMIEQRDCTVEDYAEHEWIEEEDGVPVEYSSAFCRNCNDGQGDAFDFEYHLKD